MAVRHRKIVGETIKGNCADWNDLHNVYNMATFELIEEKTTCTFSDLDEEYLIVFDGILNGTINAASGSITTSAANHTTRALSTNGFPIANSSFSDISPTVHSECRIFAKSGKKRLSSTHISAHGDRITISDDTGVWINPTTNITSLVVGTDATNFSGKFRLYQREVLND